MKKIIMIGMNPRTRSLIPWGAEDAEFWTLNEGPSKDWMQRYDVVFQIHARWDWDRSNNLADPNHPRYIKAESGECLYCKGSAKVWKDGTEHPCPWCEGGQYHVPHHRMGKKIIMQDQNEDVPGCVRFPLELAVANLCKDGKPYFTSTLAHMLVYAMVAHPDCEIELYGFEAESNTEYAVQRPCIEYWVGYGRGLWMSIEAPGSHLLIGKHYGYQDFDQGYRSRLEFRKRDLQEQLHNAEIESVKSEGRLDALTPFKQIKRIKPLWNQAFDEHFRKKNFVSFLRGTLKEQELSIKILDAYRQDSDEATQADARALIEMKYQLG